MQKKTKAEVLKYLADIFADVAEGDTISIEITNGPDNKGFQVIHSHRATEQTAPPKRKR